MDVAIVGAGLAGSCAAAALSRQGVSVALIDIHQRMAPDFRAEKLSAPQMVDFDAFGLGDAARRAMTAFDGVWVHRFGALAEKSEAREYGVEYADLVNALRDAVPDTVHKVIGRVDDIATSADRQSVMLKDGRSITARLLVVATGLGDALRKKLAITRVVASAAA